MFSALMFGKKYVKMQDFSRYYVSMLHKFDLIFMNTI